MTKEEILQEFSDINEAYNNCTKYDTLEHMLDEVTKQKSGHWKTYLKEGLRYQCSACDSRFATPWEYCPNCGAKMESEGLWDI